MKNPGGQPSLLKREISSVWAIAWPLILTYILNGLVGIVDFKMVGVLGFESIAAVGMSRQVMMLIMVLMIAISGDDWAPEFEDLLRLLLDMALDAFGPRRMMWGSDFPPVSAREGYANALAFTMKHFADRSEQDREWIFGATANRLWWGASQ